MVAVPVQGLDPADLRVLSAAVDRLVRRTRPGPTAGRSRRCGAVVALGCGLRAIPRLGRRSLRRGGQHLPAGVRGGPHRGQPLRARITRPKVLGELQRREVLTVLEYAAFLTAARSL